jgi:hypothetical protein
VAETPVITGGEVQPVIAIDRGFAPPAKGDPVIAVSAPVVALIVYPEMVLEIAFAT